MSEVDSIIRARIFEKDADLQKVLKRVLPVLQPASFAALPPAEQQLVCQRAVRDVLVYQQAIQHGAQVQHTLQSEMNGFERQQQDIDDDIARTQRDIKQLKGVLEHELAMRRQREEYAQLTTLIEALPSRQDTLVQISDLQASITQLRERQQALQDDLEHKQKQFGLFVHAVHQLQQEWVQDAYASSTAGTASTAGTTASSTTATVDTESNIEMTKP